MPLSNEPSPNTAAGTLVLLANAEMLEPLSKVLVMDSVSSGAHLQAVNLDVGVKDGSSLTGTTEQEAELEIAGAINARSTSEATTHITFKPASMDITYDGQDEALDNKYMLPGYTTFHYLPESSRSRLKSRYSQSVA